MPEEYSIEIETTGDFKERKEYNTLVKLTPREFIALIEKVLDFTDDVPKHDA